MTVGVLVGMVFVLLGCLHFVARDQTRSTRSLFLGNIQLGYRTRLALAAIEVVGGFVVMFFAR